MLLRLRRASALACLLLMGSPGLGLGLARADTVRMAVAHYRDKCLGGWAGEMIGVSYGSVYEFHSQGVIYEGPIRKWEPRFVDNALGQDDLYVEMTFLKALEADGLGITNEQAGKAFAASKYALWHANRAGRDNCRKGIMPPASGNPANNPHADDIDFQIESDVFGLITPGMPGAMHKLCDRFGHIMNYGDGVYGGMFIAGMYDAAFFETDVAKVLAAGLKCLPPQSKYARLISDVVAFHRAHPADWRGCWRMLQSKWAPYDLCPDGRGTPFDIDAKLNGGYVALALLYGGGNWDKTLEIAVRCGQDSDCNPSSAGGILGAIAGYKGIPEKYRAGIPAIADRDFAYVPYSFNTLADACTHVARKVVLANGGKVEGAPARGGKTAGGADGLGEVWLIRRQAPVPPAKLEQWVDGDMDLRPRVTPGREGGRGVRIRWQTLPSAGGYRVFRAASPGGRATLLLSTTKAATDSFEDKTAPVGRVLYYRVEVKTPGNGWSRSSPLRSFVLATGPANGKGATNLAREPYAFADAAVLNPTGSGLRDVGAIRDGITRDQSYDSFDGPNQAATDWYAIDFTRATRVDEVDYVEGKNFDNGGWWLSLTVQYLEPATFQWRDCRGVRRTPKYDFADQQAGRTPYTRWTFTFDPVVCAGMRVFGKPGGSAAFTSIAELEAYYR